MADKGRSLNKYLIGLGAVLAAPILQIPLPSLESMFQWWYPTALPAYLAGGYVYYNTWEAAEQRAYELSSQSVKNADSV